MRDFLQTRVAMADMDVDGGYDSESGAARDDIDSSASGLEDIDSTSLLMQEPSGDSDHDDGGNVSTNASPAGSQEAMFGVPPRPDASPAGLQEATVGAPQEAPWARYMNRLVVNSLAAMQLARPLRFWSSCTGVWSEGKCAEVLCLAWARILIQSL